MPRKQLWRCPSCGREFRHRNQAHSCVSVSVDDHFDGKPPKLRQIYENLLAEITKSGPVRTDAVKTSINIANRAHFAMVYVLSSCLKLEFLFDKPLDSPRIVKSQQISEGKYIHFVKLFETGDIDEQLRGWLRVAYKIGAW